MRITEVKIVPLNEERLRAYVSITFDDCFVVSEIQLIRVKKGYVVRMPGRKRRNGKHIDIFVPLNNETRQMIEEKVFEAYRMFAGEPDARPSR